MIPIPANWGVLALTRCISVDIGAPFLAHKSTRAPKLTNENTMAQSPEKEAQEPQHSAMFETLATTNFEHDEIRGLLPSSAVAQNNSNASTTGDSGPTSDTRDLPYSEHGVEAGDNDEA